MILPPRKAPVETHEEEQKREQERKRSFDEILERLKRVKAKDEIRLHHLFDHEEIPRMCIRLNIEFRDRVFTPAKTLELIVHLSDRVRKMAHKMTPDEWKWNGLNVYLVDGFTLRAPDTLSMRPASHARNGTHCRSEFCIAWLIHSAGSHLARNRPGRNEPRAIKRGHTKYPKLKEPRPSHRCRKKKKQNPEITPQNA